MHSPKIFNSTTFNMINTTIQNVYCLGWTTKINAKPRNTNLSYSLRRHRILYVRTYVNFSHTLNEKCKYFRFFPFSLFPLRRKSWYTYRSQDERVHTTPHNIVILQIYNFNKYYIWYMCCRFVWVHITFTSWIFVISWTAQLETRILWNEKSAQFSWRDISQHTKDLYSRS